MMGLLTMLPTLLLMMTGFTRILIVLHFLRQALGTQSAPPAHLLAGARAAAHRLRDGAHLRRGQPAGAAALARRPIEQGQMLTTAAQPLRDFMLQQTRESDLAAFLEISRTAARGQRRRRPAGGARSPPSSPASCATAFQIGFALFLPFIVIDLVVASVLMSMGMFMVPPAMISLPFKLLLFVLVDGWSLVVQGLVSSFH